MAAQRRMTWAVPVLVLAGFGGWVPHALQAGPGSQSRAPVAHWTFDEDHDDVAHDVTGGGHDARVVGARFVPDGAGRALLLATEEAYVDAGLSPDFQGAAGGAFSLWFKPHKLQGGLVNWSKGGGWTEIRLTLAFNTYRGGNALVMSASDGRLHETISLPAPGLDVWTHMAVSFQGPNVTIFLDGQLLSTRSLNCVPDRRGTPLWIGRCEGLGEACFAGLIDEVRIFDQPIRPAGVLARYKEHAQVMGKDTRLFDAPDIDVLPMPETGRIVVTPRCALMQPLPAGATVRAGLRRDGVVVVEQASPVEAGATPMILTLDATDLTAGEYEVTAVVEAPGGAVVGRPATARVAWPGRAADFAAVKVLNNLVWELYRDEPGTITGARTIGFSNPRRRWGFYALTAEVGAGDTLRLIREEAPEDVLVTIAGPASSTAEAMRPLPPGEHRLVLTATGSCVVRELVVRSIPELVYADYFSEPHVNEHGPYAGAFLDRYVLPHINTSIISGAPGDRPDIQRWLARGGRWLNHCGVPREKVGGELAGVNVAHTPAGATPEPVDAADAVAYIAGTVGFSDPRFSGAIADEFGDSEPLCAVYADAIRQLAADARFSGRLFYPYANQLYTGPEGIDLIRAVVDTESTIAWKRYLKTQADVNAARSFLREELVDRAWEYRRAVPDSLAHIDICFGTFSAPNEFLNTNPGVDYRTYLDMQFGLAANHPAFWGTYGLMSYLASYSDEETVRWVAALMRHYGIEGRTEPLSNDCYDLPHMVNGDFADGTRGWTIEPAAADGIRVDRKDKFGWLQGRYPSTPEGDTVLVLKRNEKKPNVFSQEIRALEPGRLYSFRMFSADFDDMSKQEIHALAVTLDGVDLIPHKCFTHVGHNCYSHHAGPFDDRNRAWFNYHWRVFRAGTATAKVTISDWAEPDRPGGPIGRQIMCNFAHVRPYFPDGTE